VARPAEKLGVESEPVEAEPRWPEHFRRFQQEAARAALAQFERTGDPEWQRKAREAWLLAGGQLRDRIEARIVLEEFAGRLLSEGLGEYFGRKRRWAADADRMAVVVLYYFEAWGEPSLMKRGDRRAVVANRIASDGQIQKVLGREDIKREDLVRCWARAVGMAGARTLYNAPGRRLRRG
jgi:hypothetical protein